MKYYNINCFKEYLIGYIGEVVIFKIRFILINIFFLKKNYLI